MDIFRKNSSLLTASMADISFILTFVLGRQRKFATCHAITVYQRIGNDKGKILFWTFLMEQRKFLLMDGRQSWDVCKKFMLRLVPTNAFHRTSD